MKYKIPNSIPNILGNEIKYVNEALNSGMLTDGTYIKEFEKKIALSQDISHSVSVSSGTAALHLALLASGVNVNDEVITSATTFAATANAIIYAGANPVFVDINFSNLCLNSTELFNWINENTKMVNGFCINIKSNRRISAILLVHIYGFFSERAEIYKIIKSKNIKIIEDGAEALGSYVNNKPIAHGASIFTLSFNGNKIITSSGGGMILCKNKKTADKIRYLANQAKSFHHDFIHDEIGYNYRLSNVNAAIGLAQLEKLNEFVLKKRNTFAQYKLFFEKKNIGEMIEETSKIKSNYWMPLLRIYKNKKVNVMSIIKSMNEMGIQLRPIWRPLSLNKAYNHYEKTSKLKVAKELYENTICLPSSTSITSKEIRIVCDRLVKFF